MKDILNQLDKFFDKQKENEKKVFLSYLFY